MIACFFASSTMPVRNTSGCGATSFRAIADEHERKRPGMRVLVATEPLDELERALAGIDAPDAYEIRTLADTVDVRRRRMRDVDVDSDARDR